MRPAGKARRPGISGIFEEFPTSRRDAPHDENGSCGAEQRDHEMLGSEVVFSEQEQRRRAGCSAGRMQADFHHGLRAEGGGAWAWAIASLARCSS
jgi:hypothetical protein